VDPAHTVKKKSFKFFLIKAVSATLMAYKLNVVTKVADGKETLKIYRFTSTKERERESVGLKW
jgi:hypothetical protein